MQRILNRKEDILTLVYAQEKAIIVFDTGETWHVKMTPCQFSELSKINLADTRSKIKTLRIRERKAVKPPRYDVKQFIECYERGFTHKRLSKVFALHVGSIPGIVHQLISEGKMDKRKPVSKYDIILLEYPNLSVTALSKKYSLCRNTLKFRRKKLVENGEIS